MKSNINLILVFSINNNMDNSLLCQYWQKIFSECNAKETDYAFYWKYFQSKDNNFAIMNKLMYET